MKAKKLLNCTSLIKRYILTPNLTFCLFSKSSQPIVLSLMCLFKPLSLTSFNFKNRNVNKINLRTKM